MCLFFTAPATTAIYTLSLHDALPISARMERAVTAGAGRVRQPRSQDDRVTRRGELPRSGSGQVERLRSEEHTSELQSQSNLVCRLLLEKKNDAFAQELVPFMVIFYVA